MMRSRPPMWYLLFGTIGSITWDTLAQFDEIGRVPRRKSRGFYDALQATKAMSTIRNQTVQRQNQYTILGEKSMWNKY